MTEEEKKRRANTKLEKLTATKNAAYVEAIAEVERKKNKTNKEAELEFANMNAQSKNESLTKAQKRLREHAGKNVESGSKSFKPGEESDTSVFFTDYENDENEYTPMMNDFENESTTVD